LHLLEENATSILIHINYAISKKKSSNSFDKSRKANKYFEVYSGQFSQIFKKMNVVILKIKENQNNINDKLFTF